MSNLEDHEAEQAAITAACEAGVCDHPHCGIDSNPSHAINEAPTMTAETFINIYLDGSIRSFDSIELARRAIRAEGVRTFRCVEIKPAPPGSRYPKHLDADELEIIDLLVRDGLEAGYSIAVHGDGNRDPDLEASTDYGAITAEIAACGQTELVMTHPTESSIWVLLVHDNGCDVISDCYDNTATAKILKRAQAKAETLDLPF